MNKKKIESAATEDEIEALKCWYGQSWASKVLLDHKYSILNKTVHPLQMPAFFLSKKQAEKAFEAWKNILARMNRKKYKVEN